MNFNFESEIRTELNEFSQEAIDSRSIFRAMNDAYIDIVSKAACNEKTMSINTVSGSAIVDTGVTIIRIDKVIYAGKGLLKVLPEDVGHIPVNGTQPQYWTFWGGNLFIEPIPDAVYSLDIYYSDYPSNDIEERDIIFMGTDGVQFMDTTGVTWKWTDYDSPDELPKEFRMCITNFSLYLLSLGMKNWKQASLYYNRYLDNLDKAKVEYIIRKNEQRNIHDLPEEVQ
jgi:hypothetical protein